MDSIDNYQIRSKLDYVVLQGMAEEKFLNVVTGHVKRLIACVCLIFVSSFMVSSFYIPTTTGLIMFAATINNFVAYFGAILLVISVISVFDIIKKIRRQNIVYKGDLRRIQEKLTYSEIYMDIPKEDEKKFDSLKTVISVSLAAIKKNKKNT